MIGRFKEIQDIILIGPYDIKIAAQAVSRDLILADNNISEFQRVPLLNAVGWADRDAISI